MTLTDEERRAVERLTKLQDAWDLSGVYTKDTSAGRMDRLCNDVEIILAALSRLSAVPEGVPISSALPMPPYRYQEPHIPDAEMPQYAAAPQPGPRK